MGMVQHAAASFGFPLSDETADKLIDMLVSMAKKVNSQMKEVVANE